MAAASNDAWSLKKKSPSVLVSINGEIRDQNLRDRRIKSPSVSPTLSSKATFFCACSASDSPWIKITNITIIVAFSINQFTRVCSGCLRKRKNNQFGVQEFSADTKFHDLTRQGSKLGVLYMVISDAKFKLYWDKKIGGFEFYSAKFCAFKR